MERQPKNELVEVIDRTIAEWMESGEPTSREIADAVIAGHHDLILAFGESLALSQIREVTYGRMKEIKLHHTDQWMLPFDIEDIPSALSFEQKNESGETETRYIALGRAREWHIKAYKEILRRNIANASKNLKAIEFLDETLAPTFAAHPGITVAEACSLLKHGQEAA